MFLDDIKLLNELYYGKHPSLLEVEKQLEVIVQEIKNDPYYNVNATKENKLIEKKLSELFNFEGLSISWHTRHAKSLAGHASTLSSSDILFQNIKDMKLVKTANTIKFKNKKGKYAIIYLANALVTHTGLTAPELVGLLLHEIGHSLYISPLIHLIRAYPSIVANFTMLVLKLHKLTQMKLSRDSDLVTLIIGATKIFGVIGDILNILREIGAKKQLVILRALSKRLKEIFADIYNTPLIKEVLVLAQQLITAIEVFIEVIGEIVIFFGVIFLPRTLLSSIVTSLLNGTFSVVIDRILLKLYNEEKFADTIAATYGYGPELQSALKKIYDVTHGTFVPLGRFGREIINFCTYVTNIYDQRPIAAARPQQSIKYLEQELNNPNLSKEMKKLIEKDIKEMTEISNYLNNVEIDGETGRYMKRLFQKLITGNLGNKISIDPRDLIYNDPWKDIAIEENYKGLFLNSSGVLDSYL